MEYNRADPVFKEGFSERIEFIFDLRIDRSLLSALGTDKEKGMCRVSEAGKNLAEHTVQKDVSIMGA